MRSRNVDRQSRGAGVLGIRGQPTIGSRRLDDDRAIVGNHARRLGLFVEVQGTAEGAPFDRAELNNLLDLALGGTESLAGFQKAALA